MSFYFRHLNDVIKDAGIEVTPGNKKQINQAIHWIVEVYYKGCSKTWKAVKTEITSDEQKRREFIDKLQKALK